MLVAASSRCPSTRTPVRLPQAIVSGWPNAVPAKPARNQTIAAVDRTYQLPCQFIKEILNANCGADALVRSRPPGRLFASEEPDHGIPRDRAARPTNPAELPMRAKTRSSTAWFGAFAGNHSCQRWNEKAGLLGRHAVSCHRWNTHSPEGGAKKGDQLMSKHSKEPAEKAGRYVGIDLGDTKSRVCTVDKLGQVVLQEWVTTTPQAFLERFSNRANLHIAMEVGTHSRWASEALMRCGHEVIVADARQLALITNSDAKSDKRDARTLAQLVWADPACCRPSSIAPRSCSRI